MGVGLHLDLGLDLGLGLEEEGRRNKENGAMKKEQGTGNKEQVSRVRARVTWKKLNLWRLLKTERKLEGGKSTQPLRGFEGSDRG